MSSIIKLTEQDLVQVINKVLLEQTKSPWKACKNMFDKGAIRLVSNQPFPQNMFKSGADIVVQGYKKNPGANAINGQTKVLAVDPYRKWIKIDKPWPKGVKGIQDECATVSIAKKNNGGCNITAEKMKNCQAAWNKEIPKAIKFWRDWLSHPETKKKVQKNWDVFFGSGTLQMAYYYPKYMSLLNSIKKQFYNCSMKNFKDDMGAYAFVYPEGDNTIYMNCSAKPKSIFQTLIHEIQHLIYGIKPLNPEKKMRDLFVTKNTKPEDIKSIQNNLVSSKVKNKQPSNNINNRINQVAKSLNIPADYLFSWKEYVDDLVKKGKKDYICEFTEKMSNVIAMRSQFNLQPGQNITLKMILPYIKLQKTNNNISWFLCCWVNKGFPDLVQVLNKTNDLAKTNANQEPPTNNSDNLERPQVS